MAQGFRLPGYEVNNLLDFSPINNALATYRQQQQQGIENERQNRLLQFQEQQAQQRMGLARDQFGMEREKFAREDARYNDPMAVKARQLEIERTNAQIAQSRAAAAASTRAGEPEIVRQLRAAGIDPQSDEGRTIIRNSIKGGGPIDQAIASRINGLNQAPQAPAMPPKVQLQSNPGGMDGDPALIRTQAASGQPSPQGASVPDDPVVQTPLGPMPRSQAGVMAFGLAMQGKGEAGKMLMGETAQGGIGKTGQGELDKEIIAKATDVSDLTAIKNAFKPEFLGLEGRVRSTGLKWADWLNSKGVTDEQRQYLTDYTNMATATTERLNNRIKALSGAAVSAAEEKRMFAANPTMNDSPTEFQAKLNTQLDMQRMAIARYNWLKTRFRGTDEDIARLSQSGRIQAYPLDSMKKIYNDRGAEIERELRQRGIPTQQINDYRRRQLLQEFGI